MNVPLLRHIAAPSLLLVAVIFICYGTPRPTKYVSTNVLKLVSLPAEAGNWTGKDIDEKLNLGEGYYAYLGDLRTRKYTRPEGGSIYMTLMDAGNFHHPKLCFQGAGYTPEELPDTTIATVKNTFDVPTIFFKKKNANTLVLYWLCLDKQRVGWSGQKVRDLWNSILGRKRIGIIVRLDIRTSEAKIPIAVEAAKDLMMAISIAMDQRQAEFIFGK